MHQNTRNARNTSPNPEPLYSLQDPTRRATSRQSTPTPPLIQDTAQSVIQPDIPATNPAQVPTSFMSASTQVHSRPSASSQRPQDAFSDVTTSTASAPPRNNNTIHEPTLLQLMKDFNDTLNFMGRLTARLDQTVSNLDRSVSQLTDNHGPIPRYMRSDTTNSSPRFTPNHRLDPLASRLSTTRLWRLLPHFKWKSHLDSLTNRIDSRVTTPY